MKDLLELLVMVLVDKVIMVAVLLMQLGGGGGGAGGVGQAGNVRGSQLGGDGGAGLQYSISGSTSIMLLVVTEEMKTVNLTKDLA